MDNNNYINNDINYHDANIPCDYDNGYPVMNSGVFPAPYNNTSAYTDTPGNVTIPGLSQSYPTASSNLSHPPQYVSQYNGRNATQFIQTDPLQFNSLNMTNSSQINRSEIFTFDIPGIKIIIIPTFLPMTYSSQSNHSETFTFDIPGTKFIIIPLSFQ